MYYLKRNDEQFSLQLDNFANKIGNYAELFSILPAEVSSIQADNVFFAWTIQIVKRYDETKKGWTSFKNGLRFGLNHIDADPIPDAVITSPVPDEVEAGIQFRFTTLVNRIKAHQNYSVSIGLILGIEEQNFNRLPLENVQPILKAVMRGGLVNLDWKKGGYDGIVIEKDSGAGFVVFDKDMRPNFIDPTPIPPASQSTVWRYRAMYLYNDGRVGNWSDIVSITVGD